MNAYEIRLEVLKLAQVIARDAHIRRYPSESEKGVVYVGPSSDYKTKDVLDTAAVLYGFVEGPSTVGSAVVDAGKEMKSAFERMAKLSPESKRRKE